MSAVATDTRSPAAPSSPAGAPIFGSASGFASP